MNPANLKDESMWQGLEHSAQWGRAHSLSWRTNMSASKIGTK
jgi:hypothetical protein